VACKLGTNLSQVAAIDVIGVPDSLIAGDTLHPVARAFDGRGDSVPGAVVRWSTLDPTILTVEDSVTGTTVVAQVGSGPGRLEARTGSLFSNPTSIQPLAEADTVFADSSTTLTDSLPTAPAPASVAGPLRVILAHTTPAPSTTGLAGRPIVFTITGATTPGSATLVTTDTTRTFIADTVITDGAGIGSVNVHLLPGSPTPDSVIVTAGAIRDRCLGACASSSLGLSVPGSPVTFVVRFVR
jgi:hypothetical protein